MYPVRLFALEAFLRKRYMSTAISLLGNLSMHREITMLRHGGK